MSAAAKNAADVESLALQAGLKKGGAAKGELVLAIFELANCFRHGWGIEKDAIAAKQVCALVSGLHRLTCSFPMEFSLDDHGITFWWCCGGMMNMKMSV